MNQKGEEAGGTEMSKNPMKLGRRCTVDLTIGASDEATRICKLAGISLADLFRYSLLLMGIYTDAVKAGKEMRVVKPGASSYEIVVLPLFVKEDKHD